MKWGGGIFHFAAAVCGACPLRAQCVKGIAGRTIRVHPQEALLQAARARQASPAGRDDRARRQVVEHRIARLVQLGIRQARYVGRAKTLFQVLLAAAVANLTLLANAAGGEPERAALAGLLAAFAMLLPAAHRSHSQRPEPPRGGARSPALSGVGSAPWPGCPVPAAFRTAGSRPDF